MTSSSGNPLLVCPTCGGHFLAEAVGGHCPACLFKTIADEQTDAETVIPSRRREFGDYELLEEIARGGMGIVYRARQRSLGRIVAVKMILAGEFARPAFVRRFRSEAAAAAALSHPNIVTVHEVGEQDGQHFFSMEYVDGRDFASLVRDRPMAARLAAAHLRAIADAVHFAHERGILHRDLKPSNILLDPLGQPRITDFGLARRLSADGELTRTGQMLGSPSYMAPEQVTEGSVDVRTDVYGLGAVLYHLVAGRPPFQAESLSAVLQQVGDTDPISPRLLNPNVPRDLETICLKCLEKTPARRYASARELAEELDRFLADQPIRARPAGPVERIYRSCRRRPAFAAVTAMLAVAVVAGFAGVLSQWRRAERHRAELERSDRVTRLNLYAADIQAASRAVDRGDYGLARHLLDAHLPTNDVEDLRGFEWYYLDGRSHGQQKATLRGHQWIVTSAAFSPDGRWLASGSQDQAVNIWDSQTGQRLTRLEPRAGAVWNLAFDAGGTTLLTSGSDNQVKLWDTTRWQVTDEFPGQLASLSSTAGLLVTSSGSPFEWQPPGLVILRDLRTRQTLLELEAPGRAVALSPDGTLLAVAMPKRNIQLRQVPTGALIREFDTDEMIWSLTFSANGEHLAATPYLGDSAYVWRISGSAPVIRLRGHTRTVWSAVFSPDGERLVTTGSDRTVRVWDTGRWSPVTTLRGHQNEVWCATFAPDGRSFATGGKDGHVLLWNRETPRATPDIPNSPHFCPRFSPDGRYLLTRVSSDDGANVLLTDLRSKAEAARLPGYGIVGFSPSGTQLVRVDESTRRLEIFDPATRETVRAFTLEVGPLPFARWGFTSSWRHFFGIDQKGMVHIWDVRDGTLQHRFPGLDPPIRSAELSGNLRWMAISAERADAEGKWGSSLFEVPTGKVTRLNTHKDHVAGQAFSHDHRLLATASVDGTIKLWDLETGTELASLAGSLEEATHVDFSPDDRTLASVEQFNCIKLWHVPTRRELVNEPMATASLYVKFSPDGRHLAVSSHPPDSAARLFSIPDKAPP